MSESTIVSIVPFAIKEFKPGIYPGTFEIAASKNEEPSILTIGNSIYYVEIDEDRSIPVTCPSEDLAKSIVNDYLISNLEYSENDNAAPGIFYIPKKVSKSLVKIDYADKLKWASVRQNNWFKKLVELADDDWEKTRQHKTISDIQRYAAKALKLERPWIIVPKDVELKVSSCPACQEIIPTGAIVCRSCRCIIDVDAYNKLSFAGEPK